MVGISILAILVTVVLPGFGTVLQRNQMVTNVNDFVLALNLARSESVRRGARVTVTAVDASNTANEWGPGWQVRDAAGTVIRSFGAVAGGLTFNGPAGVAAVAYNSRGILCNISGAACTTPGTARTFDLCFDDADIGVRVQLNTVGRPDTDSLDGDGVCQP